MKASSKKSKKNEDEEVIYSFHITNVHTNCSINQLYESVDILKLGEVCKIIIHTHYYGPVSGKEKDKTSRQSEAYVYYKSTQKIMKKHPFLKKMFNTPTKTKGKDADTTQENKTINLIHLLDGDTWKCQLNTTKFNHFRTDEYEQKRIIIQSIDSSKHSTDINWIFREHGKVEQVDTVWIKSEEQPFPKRCQSYVYFKEWGDEEYTYKLLEELNETGVFTIKYDYNNYHDILWVYELSPISETCNDYDFEYGKYQHWIPKDDPKYGSRTDEGNKLNWYFTDEGRFAYSNRIVDDEIKKYGGLFIGPDKQFYKIEIERKPLEFSWTTSGDVDETVEIKKMQQIILEALQKCLSKNVSIEGTDSDPKLV